jgi:DNA-binding NarL/FixJ family response regulator
MTNRFVQTRHSSAIKSDEFATFEAQTAQIVPDIAQQPGEVSQILTPRECDIAHGVYEGLSNKEIARRLDISPWTVSSHLRHVFAKLGITRRIELCRMWHQYAYRRESAGRSVAEPAVGGRPGS